jgi:hypothetical protein
MAKQILILICFLILTTGAFSQTQKPAVTQDSQTLVELGKVAAEIYDAKMAGTKTVIDKYYADAYLGTDSTGALQDKAWNLTNFYPIYSVVAYRMEKAQSREYDKTAVLYYKLFLTFEEKSSSKTAGSSKSIQEQYQVTDTFFKTDKGWKLIASSQVKVPNPQSVK